MFAAFDSWLSFHIFGVLTASAAYFASAVFGLMEIREEKGTRNATGFWAFLNTPESLDQMSRRLLILGTVLWGVGGIGGGAMFSQDAWGRYWSWEPKEVMTLVTFAFYLLYLVSAYVFKWSRRRRSWMSVLGFCIVLFTALGAESLGGLHSFQTSGLG